jgi:hypothetical protein
MSLNSFYPIILYWGKTRAYQLTKLAVCVATPIQLLNQWTDLHETLHEPCTTVLRGHNFSITIMNNNNMAEVWSC